MLRYSSLATIWVLVCGLSLTGCGVYVPMRPVMPLVSAQNPVELHASVQYDGHVEVMGAYTPLPHVLVTGATAVAVKFSEQNYLVSRQAEIGVGAYWKLGNKWLLNGIGGVGTAYGERKDFNSGYNRGNYQKLFGQVGLAYQKHNNVVGITYRLGNLDYRNIQHNDRPIPPFHDVRHESSLFWQYALGNQQKWYLQSVFGLSLSSLRPPSDDTYRPFASDKWFAAGGGEYLFSIGAVWRPSIGGRKGNQQ